MGESTVRIGITTQTAQAETGIKSVHGLLLQLGTAAKQSILTGVGLGAGVSAFNLMKTGVSDVIGVLKESVQLGIAQEDSASRLGAAIRANVPAWDGNTAAIEKSIKAGEDLGFTDIDQRNALAGLVAATHDAAQAQNVMSVAMDLARFKHISLQEASDALTKVEAGRFRILASLGIVLQKGATSTEALAAVEKVAAGQAAAFGDTTAGAMEEAGVAIESAKESIGKALLPVIKEMAIGLKNAIPTVLQVGGVLLDIGKVAAPLAALWLGSKLVAALQAVKLSAAGALGPLGLIITAGMALGAAEKDSLAAGLQQQIQMKDGAAAAKAFGDAMAATGGDIGKSLDAMRLSFKGTFSEIPMIVDRGVEDSRRGLTAGVNVISDAAYQTYDPIKWQADQAAKVAAQTSAKIPQMMGDAMLKHEKDLTDSVTTMLDVLKTALTPAEADAAAIGFLTSDAYAQALASGKPAAIAKAQELANAALVQLHGALADGTAAGTALGTSWAQGIANAINATNPLVAYYIGKTKNLLGGSLPEEGPLKGDTAAKGGLAVGMSWGTNLRAGLAASTRGLLDGVKLPGVPSIGSGGGMALAGAAGGAGGPVVHIHIDQGAYIDGPSIDLLAQKITNRLRYAPGI